ncbi:response regulator [Actinomadura macra]|uniref:response regulator n=1 Tax=Actinomadura macra TaxID=46164 RepID=UPI000A842155
MGRKAEAGTAAQVPDAVERHRPDVVLMDIMLPDSSGIEATRTLGERAPDVRPGHRAPQSRPRSHHRR